MYTCALSERAKITIFILMNIMLKSTNDKYTLYENVADKIHQLIIKGTYIVGERIPSIRQLSAQLNVSINTVKEAYALLECKQIIKDLGEFIKR